MSNTNFNFGLKDLSGIEVFVNLTELFCSNNLLTTLPILPPKIRTLDCSYNLITSISSLPDSLTNLFIHKNQLTSIPSLPAKLSTFHCYENQLNSLPTLPNTIYEVKCGDNQLTTLPSLPASLQYLHCEKNQLVSIPQLPISLKWLMCYGNSLTTLPTININLEMLRCMHNQLTSIPSINPGNLKELNFSNNQVTSLPILPPSLKVLTCNNNSLDSLPVLPTNLESLSCINCQLTFLPSLTQLHNLEYIILSQNQLSSLPASLPGSLEHIDFSNNQFTSLPPLPSYVKYLDCSNNFIDSLPVANINLKYLDCSHNLLTQLPSFYNYVDSIFCGYNLITSLPSFLPNNLKTLDCRNNQITSILEYSWELNKLYCQNNPISCLNRLKGVTHLDISGTQINCLLDYGVVVNCNPPISSIPICDVFNTNGCDLFWNIGGVAFIDSIPDCYMWINEPKFRNHKVILYKNGVFDQYTYTNSNGEYDFNTFSFDVYKSQIDTAGMPFEIKCPNLGLYIDTVSAIDSMKYDRNFGVRCKGIDLVATDIYASDLRPSSVREIKIKAGDFSNRFGMYCANGKSGTVQISITGACSYHSPGIGALTPTNITGNVLTYDILDFGTLQYDYSFNFNILVDLNAMLDSQICIQVSLSTKTIELNYNNNLLSKCFTVVGSFDPNDKIVYPSSNIDISGDRWLTYSIRFQNTGTADAENIFIVDTLNPSLDWSSFSLLSYSHTPQMQINNDGIIKFNFPNIHLPDSNTNEPASHGYVQYKIRAKDSLLIGSTIENTANIFFDFNAPLITNTTSNTVINCSIPPTIITAIICNGDAYSLNGVLYYNDGTYQQKLITSVGCDSIIELQLTVSSITNTVSQSSAILQTTASGSGYQWIDCATNSAIASATNSTYQPTQSGDYAVAVTYGNCIDTSSCFSFSMVGLPSSIAADVIFQTNYNSNSDHIQLHAEKLKGNKGVLRLMDISGRIIFQKQIENIATGNLDIEIPAKGMNAGIYLVNLITERDNVSGKVVKY
ncbi:MAG: leucine-rich repeat domain-containing protein [Bacteroidetes bacterium]|nr:leucine-rich repeat domain-containing protein [Bacteroidota bacterium]